MRRALPVDPVVACILGVEHAFAVAQAGNECPAGILAQDVAVGAALLLEGEFDHLGQALGDGAEEAVPGLERSRWTSRCCPGPGTRPGRAAAGHWGRRSGPAGRRWADCSRPAAGRRAAPARYRSEGPGVNRAPAVPADIAVPAVRRLGPVRAQAADRRHWAAGKGPRKAAAAGPARTPSTGPSAERQAGLSPAKSRCVVRAWVDPGWLVVRSAIAKRSKPQTGAYA